MSQLKESLANRETGRSDNFLRSPAVVRLPGDGLARAV
jgi:hypothetical protein